MNAPTHRAALRLPLDMVRAATGGQLALPSVPSVVRRLITELRSGDPQLHSLVADLEQEPQLAARTLRIANSPYYCGRRSVASLHDAVVVIGMQALRTLVISCGLESAFVSLPGVNLRQFWLDANLTGRASRSLARLTGHDGEAAFLAGLLHGVGHLILFQAFAKPMRARFVGAQTLRGQALAEAEADCCGLCYPDVGAAWLDELGFPEDIVDAVAQHLLVQQMTLGGMVPPLAAVLALATQLCAAVDAHDDAAHALARLDARLLGLAAPRQALAPDAFAIHYQALAGGQS